MRRVLLLGAVIAVAAGVAHAADFQKPQPASATVREDVFSFTQKPTVKMLEKDKYEIAFAVKGNCDVAVDIVDPKGVVVRHIGAGVLGANAPKPFQKNSLSQKVYWSGKDDLDYYVKEPEKMKARVRLGLKPVFDKRLGGASPKNLPGAVMGLAIGPDAAYIISKGLAAGFGHGTIRKYDREGKYLGALVTPPAGTPDKKLGGLTYVEYEPGKKAIHAPGLQSSVAHGVFFHPPYTLDGDSMTSNQPVVVGDKLVFANSGYIYASPGSFLHYIYADGSTDVRGIKGIVLAAKGTVHADARVAASPDGKRVYLSGLQGGKQGNPGTCVYVIDFTGKGPGKVFAGKHGKPGTGNDSFNGALGIDTDAQSRVYIADSNNSRVQIYAPDGKYLKTIKIDRPELVAVHKKTGAIYIQHTARVRGQSLRRLTKLVSFDNPKEDFHADGFPGLFALDSWSAKPRLWWSGMLAKPAGHADSIRSQIEGKGSITIWEERGKKFEKIVDFETDAVKEAGASWWGRWNGEGSHTLGVGGRIACDPTREKLYYRFSYVFDLTTGKYEGRYTTNSGCPDDTAFDKRGYMHGRQNPRSKPPCVWRVDPARAEKTTGRDDRGRSYAAEHYPECPYDYGVERKGGWKGSWLGALALRDQGGAKGFQDGFGVNMRGQIAVESNIYYVPKMEDEGKGLALQGTSAQQARGRWCEEGNNYNAFVKSIKDAEKRGEKTYFVPRRPGIPLAGATIWTFDATGEESVKTAAVPGNLLAGVQIDEDGYIYFSMRRTRFVDGKKFLEGKGGMFGGTGGQNPFTGTYVKAKVDTFRLLEKRAIVPMDQPLKRPFDVTGVGGGAWLEGIEWAYAGASPIVTGGCSCPSMRTHLDWYKRSFVPEIYRHSIGVLDTNGNVIMHLGQYGNFDTAPGGKDGAKPGGTDIGMLAARYIGGTDNYLCFEDWGERLIVLKLDYHAGETAPIAAP